MATIIIHGETLTPDPLGGLYWRREDTLIVSDLHFEKGSSFAARGVMLPPYDTRTTLMRLGALMRRYRPRRVISLGDAFHDRYAEARMTDEDASALEAMTGVAEWLWILGNHDPEPPARFRGACDIETRIGRLIFRHEPKAGAAPGEIAGHLHPCARVAAEGRTLRRRCFASSADRLIMPAMGAYTGGLNILDAAYATLFSKPVAWVMGGEGVYPIAAENLRPDAQGRAMGRAV
ncbi:ligase-associated DNA damage response endonuclease PdeM [Hyphococcus sp.]|uniref:ligase-associated DNA damage response endonuclease PdeM n=1 Tax=Hyphococcus sp. TaxID=2038636 RepID=UPI003CCBDAB3